MEEEKKLTSVQKHSIAQAKWDAANTQRYTLKLNIHTDADLIEYLKGKNVAGTLKKALRLLVEVEEK